MKRIVFLFIILILAFAGCTNTPASPSSSAIKSTAPTSLATEPTNALSLKTEKSAYPVNAESITCTVVNDTDQDCTYGLYYTLEFLKDDTWENIELDGLSVNDIAVILSAHSSDSISYDIYKYTGELAEGTYRLAMSVYGIEGKEQVLTAEFQIN